MEIKFDTEKQYDEFVKWLNDKTPNKEMQERLKRHRELRGRRLTYNEQLELSRTILNKWKRGGMKGGKTNC